MSDKEPANNTLDIPDKDIQVYQVSDDVSLEEAIRIHSKRPTNTGGKDD